ncbi:hypothetical protein V1520DRAFT_277175 [Lipomyces starkeyi]|uniref:Uncharacterized protein n=1 Tax=Lipomyces starkeyi NRRL Y-11557 TaxID=675824 RepID=A0A1E3Q449_LIPST|nr:hypothetical protein LIPSTDRAFT_3781 [Lipomyces starkeyi NRRL Y-11557]
MPLPIVIGYSAIGRAVAVGSDAVKIAPGQLVLADNYIRGRDVADVSFLAGLHEEYTKVPLENCFPLDEERLLGKVENGGLGYRMEDLPYFTLPPVPYGGLVDIALLTGETIIIALATGTLGVAHFLRMSTSTSVQLSMTTCKAELTRLSETLRLETPFGVNVLTVVTGAVGSNFFVNTPEYKLPSTSRYKPIETRIATWQGVRTISLG